jgi:predicted metal-dependent HD superfamily phosphohydrolase
MISPERLESMQKEWVRLLARFGVGAAEAYGPFDRLVAAYSGPERHYHNLEHLGEMFRVAGRLAAHTDDPAALQLAIWFHDAVYDPQRHDNEERSADWALRSVLAAGCDEAIGQRVRSLVLATAGHEASADPDTQLLLDIDLAILGAAPARFAEYERQVRAEYAHVPEPDFLAGRARILAGFLARPRLFGTAPFHDALEQRARVNLRQAMAALQD